MKEGGLLHEDKVPVDDALKSISHTLARYEPLAAFESAGTRRKIFFDTAKACCAAAVQAIKVRTPKRARSISG
jgi:hypothetical protein